MATYPRTRIQETILSEVRPGGIDARHWLQYPFIGLYVYVNRYGLRAHHRHPNPAKPFRTFCEEQIDWLVIELDRKWGGYNRAYWRRAAALELERNNAAPLSVQPENNPPMPSLGLGSLVGRFERVDVEVEVERIDIERVEVERIDIERVEVERIDVERVEVEVEVEWFVLLVLCAESTDKL